MSIYDKASLVLIPSGTKTSKVYSQVPVNGDGDFTFSRSTAATRVNADGNIEKETQNLIDYSNTFNQWSVSSVTFLGGQTGYDGSSDATRITSSANGGQIRNNESFSGVNTLSVYAKQGSQVGFRLRMDADTDAEIYVDLRDGSLFSSNNIIDYNIEDLGSGWYRCSFAANVSNGVNIRIYPVNSSGSISTGSILIQDAQLEQGLVARDYIETTTTAVEGGITDNVPRLDYTDASCPSLLLEPQRTNSHLHSEYIAGWTTPTSQGFESNSIISPEGVQNATKIINTNGGSSWIRQLPSVVVGQKQVISCFAKEGNRDIFNITYYDATDGDRFFNYNLSTETISGNGLSAASYVDSGIEDYGNGWYRCYVVITAGNASPQIQMAVGTNRSASANDYIYLWGAQHEQNATYATSYIPTYGSAVTRNQDTSLVTGASDLIGQPNGSIFLDFVYDNNTSNTRIFSVTGANWFTNGSIRLEKVSNLFRWNWLKEGVGGASLDSTTTMVKGTRYKMVITYTDSVCSLFINGTKEDTSACDTPTNLSGIYLNELGGGYSDGWEFQRNIFNQVLMFNTTLTDQEAIDLTTI